MSGQSRLWTACLTALLGAILSLPLVRLVQAGERYTILPNLEVDASAYDSFALEVARTHSLDAIPPVFPPGFVAIVAVVYATVGHSLVAAKALLWLCLVLATIGAGFLARRVHGTRAAGWTAAFLTASSAALQAYTGTLQYEVLVSALILLLIALALTVAGTNRPGVIIRRAAILGVVLGLAALVREPLIAFIPVFAFFVAHQATRAARARVGLAAGLTLLLCATLLPGVWSAVQSRRMGYAMLVRDNVQGILPFGHNPNANGTWNTSLVDIGQPAGVAFMLAQPRRELWLVGRKLMYFWGILRDGWNPPRPGAVWIARATGGLLPLDLILPAVRGGWLLAAFITACAAYRRSQWRELWLLPAIVTTLMAVHLVTISSHRFAVPILPVVFVVIAGIVARALTRWTPLGTAGVVVVVVGAGLAMQVAQWPVSYRLQPTELDGVRGENRRERDGRLVRFSDAARGRRVAFSLNDEYLPSGPLILRLQVRRGPGELPAMSPVARVSLFLLDGTPPCETFVTLGQIGPPDNWASFALSCRLPNDGTARLIVETLGEVDLSFSDVTLRWQRG